MRFCHDFEFLERPGRLDHISVGIVGEDGREYYAVNADMPVDDVLEHDFLRREVWPQLPTCGEPIAAAGVGQLCGSRLDVTHPDVKPLPVIAEEARQFLLAPGTPVELWAYYSAFDHVALAWLWGPMVDMPAGVPWYSRDIKGEAVRLGNPRLPQQPAGEHDALADARHDWTMLRALEEIELAARP